MGSTCAGLVANQSFTMIAVNMYACLWVACHSYNFPSRCWAYVRLLHGGSACTFCTGYALWREL